MVHHTAGEQRGRVGSKSDCPVRAHLAGRVVMRADAGG